MPITPSATTPIPAPQKIGDQIVPARMAPRPTACSGPKKCPNNNSSQIAMSANIKPAPATAFQITMELKV